MTVKSDAPLTALSRVELKRADLFGLIEADGLLRSCALVRALGVEGLRGALSVSVGRRFRPDKAVYEAGDAGDSVFLVLRGEARLMTRDRGESVEAGVARKGEVFGEAGALDGVELRTSSAIAAGELEVLELPRAVLFSADQPRPELRAYLSEIRGRREQVAEELSAFLKRW